MPDEMLVESVRRFAGDLERHSTPVGLDTVWSASRLDLDAPSGNGHEPVIVDLSHLLPAHVDEVEVHTERGRGRGWVLAAAAAVLVIALVNSAFGGSDEQGGAVADDAGLGPSPSITAPRPTTAPVEIGRSRCEPYRDATCVYSPDGSGVAPAFSTPLPDFASVVPGDDGGPSLPRGEVDQVPDSKRLDFLTELCQPRCFRDAQFVYAASVSGTSLADTPFHVRHGFVNEGGEPLGPGFSVVLYLTPMSPESSEDGGDTVGPTYRYEPDYVMHGSARRCGPTYRVHLAEHESVPCEWFVHDFPDGLPAGRWAMWAMWEAPCRAWVDLGFIDRCDDPDEVRSLFSSGVDSPFE